MKELLNSIVTNQDIFSLLISSIATFIAVISTVVSIFANYRSQKHYKESIKPQLSMKLENFNGILYLQIKNTGKMVARKINITPIEIRNNGENENFSSLKGLFSMQFELYPEEIVQTEVQAYYQTIVKSVFPQLKLYIEYSIDGVKKKVKYYRTVTFVPAYDSKIVADINLDNSNIEKSLKSISRAAVRTANYLDGCQIAEFDELNIIAGKTLRNDLKNVVGQKEEIVLTRKETIKNQLSK